MRFVSKFRRQFLTGSTCIAAIVAMGAGAMAQPIQVAALEPEAVMVTATKRETDVRQTAISIAVISAENMKSSQITSLLDVAGSVPSLRLTTFEARQSALTVGIRGVVPNDANQPAREQGVGVYLDGVYLGRQQGLNASMLDLERVEVLRGPQGTLFGRNSEGGALSLVTRRPSGTYGLRASLGGMNYDGYNVDAHLDLPTVAGVSVKFDAAMQKHDATIKNPMSGQTGWNYVDRHGFRVSALWTPFEALELLYSFDYGKSLTSPFISQLVNYNPNNLPVSAAFPRPAGTIAPLPPNVFVHTERQDVADIGVPQQPSVDKTSGHTLRMNWTITPDISLRSITGFRDVAVQQYDNSGGPNRPPVFSPSAPEGNSARNFSRYSLSDMSQYQRSQELQLVGSALGGHFDYVVGAYYFFEKAKEEAATPSSLTWVGSAGAYVVRDPNTAGITRGFRSIDRGSFATSESMGIFAHTVYNPDILDNALKITLGGRLTWDDKNGTLYKVANAARNYTFSLQEDRFDPVATVAFDITPEINTYATYSTGYRAGGANSRSLTFKPFASEEVTSYEIGMKSVVFDRFNMNLALFSMDRINTQVEFTLVAPDPVSNTNRNTVETVNAPGTSVIRGLEFDMSGRITENLRANISYAYTEANIPDAQNPFPASAACPACGQIQKVYTIYTPRHAASASLDYDYPLRFADIRFHLDANYSTGTQSFEQSAQKTDNAFLVNARLSLADWQVGHDNETLTLALWSRNLLDNAYIYRRSTENRTGTNAIGDYANFNEPRTFGLELSWRN